MEQIIWMGLPYNLFSKSFAPLNFFPHFVTAKRVESWTVNNQLKEKIKKSAAAVAAIIENMK